MCGVSLFTDGLGFGLEQPILVRPIGNRFEIVFGERRWLAHLAKNIEKIDCFVKELSDAETIERQWVENHDRLEPDPLDDAFTFAYLKTEKNYSIHDLSIKFKISEANVLRRLKLNDLIDEAKQQLSDGTLPLGHAVFMATLPEAAQKEIVDTDLIYHYQDDDYKIATLAEFKQEVEEEIIRDLSNAPFDVSNPELHIKKLICADCPQRTGFEPKLFEEDFNRGDKCLNKKCFELKSNTHLRLKQQEIAEQMVVTSADDQETSFDELQKNFDEKLGQKLKAVPLVTEKHSVERKELPVKGNVLTSQEIFDEPECEFSILSLAVAGAKKGQKVYTCQNDKCPVHHPETITPEEKSGPTDAELLQKENLYQIQVAIAVRKRVFEKAIEHFDGYNSFWQNADLVEKLLVELVSQKYGYLIYIDSIFKGWKNFPKSNTPENVEKFVAGLDARRKEQLLFLCVFAAEGFMLPVAVGEYRSQAEIEKLAKSYAKIDYDRLDADVRVELAPDEFKPIAEKYRDEFQKKPTLIPRFRSFDFEFPKWE